MQLDNTRLAVRERGMLDILDLALHVIREYFFPLLGGFLVVAGPLAALNHLLTFWMLRYMSFDEEPGFRFLWAQTFLVFSEAQVATILSTMYLGQSVFLAEPKFRDLVRDALRMLWPLFVVHGLWRALAGVLLCYLLIFDEPEVDGFFEVFLVIVCVCVAIGVRMFRPFITEIVVLERNRLTSRSAATMTIGKRSAALHGPSGGDLFARWLGTALVCAAMITAFTASLWLGKSMLLNDWTWGSLSTQVLYPLALWMTVLYVSVVRFLCYLDLRIRQEGWEVELRIRAEAGRLARQASAT